MSVTGHIKMGDIVTGIAESPPSQNRRADALSGWPSAADRGNSMYLHNPGQWIYDGEIEMGHLLLRELPILADGFRPPDNRSNLRCAQILPPEIAAQAPQSMARAAGVDMASTLRCDSGNRVKKPPPTDDVLRARDMGEMSDISSQI